MIELTRQNEPDIADDFVRTVKVLRVIDGDTVDVNIDLGFDMWYNLRLRLHGIDAPEVHTRDLDEKKRGLIASAWLKSMLNSAEAVTIRTVKFGSTGKYGRYLAIIYADGINLNNEILREKLAKPYGT